MQIYSDASPHPEVLLSSRLHFGRGPALSFCWQHASLIAWKLPSASAFLLAPLWALQSSFRLDLRIDWSLHFFQEDVSSPHVQWDKGAFLPLATLPQRSLAVTNDLFSFALRNGSVCPKWPLLSRSFSSRHPEAPATMLTLGVFSYLEMSTWFARLLSTGVQFP